MVDLLITIDTELRPSFDRNESGSVAANIDSNVWGITTDGEYGVRYQLDSFRMAGITAVFFVEALCSKVIGTDALARIIEPILTDGHEVQLHLHPEWLRYMEHPPVPHVGRNNMKELTEDEQLVLIDIGFTSLTTAGARNISAFRAGNYGANNATLRALRRAGLDYDSSYNALYLGRPCAIELDRVILAPREIEGVLEVPVTHYEDFPGHARHLQLGACSTAEIAAVLREAQDRNLPICTLVSHSFELLNAGHTRLNPILLRRFRALCDFLTEHRATIRTIGFDQINAPHAIAKGELPQPNDDLTRPRSRVRHTVWRAIEQAIGRFYD